jgi:hypothetical protein
VTGTTATGPVAASTPPPTPWHPSRVTRWENRDEQLPLPLLTARLHVDLQRVSSAVCPGA